MNVYRAVALAVALLVAAPRSGFCQAVSPAGEPETKSRVDSSVTRQILAPATAQIDRHRYTTAKLEFERIIADPALIRPLGDAAVYDLTTEYAVQLCMSARPRLAVPYLRQLVQESRKLFGRDHPETALAATDFADCLDLIAPEKPDLEKLQAYAEAFRIRYASLGADNLETVYALVNLQRTEGLGRHHWRSEDIYAAADDALVALDEKYASLTPSDAETINERREVIVRARLWLDLRTHAVERLVADADRFNALFDPEASQVTSTSLTLCEIAKELRHDGHRRLSASLRERCHPANLFGAPLSQMKNQTSANPQKP
jgi:hypothetical protein